MISVSYLLQATLAYDLIPISNGLLVINIMSL